jgi:hypothetical protein
VALNALGHISESAEHPLRVIEGDLHRVVSPAQIKVHMVVSHKVRLGSTPTEGRALIKFERHRGFRGWAV